MSEDIGFGIVGAGMIAEFHAAAIVAVPGAKLRAVYARRPEAGAAFAEKHGCAAFDSLAALAADPSVRAVCITTPNGAHAEAAVPLLEAGKAVLCEKPLDISLEAIRRILDAEKRGGGILAGVFQNRLGCGAGLLKHAIESGRFGRLTLCSAYIKWWRDQNYYDSSNWKGTWALDGGGALMNQGIHAVDLLQWLAGLPEEVSGFFGTLAHTGMEAEDTVVAALRFPHGGLGVIEASTSSFPGSDLRIEIIGDRGSATLVNDQITRWEFAEPEPGDEEIVNAGAPSEIGGGTSNPGAIKIEGHRRLIEDLVGAIRENRAPMIAGREAARSVALALAIYETARSGKVTKVVLEG
ncbi:MAG: Gfo/Idh/MocA family oxidoreductase [Chthoniobacteraceae bacterium]